ncbi:hypothetical protein DFR24_2179 [Panacagrimonas perspica]|uniref:Uncharacterized protein n=1 Tax=Panacagrimonas perspica TaxID=381431 RepID=A0A4R7PEX1_9GAMM|nr:hypothetical protein [Panacagrimonas perspica]TDU32775.1 hypothetical protein DFR24_2179 [Panacagrimonas perspica]THD05652.1 hypothetical protein B1810_02760 [Panacagrimonas perspica]
MAVHAIRALIPGLLLAVSSAHADPQPKFEPMTEQMLIDTLPVDATLEVRVDADLNGDGIVDTAFIGGTEEKRLLKVMLGYKDEFDWGHAPAGELELDSYPLGPATLSVKKGVLVVEDLTGGTTATSATYRYRYDAKLPVPGMRLIGLDAENYSRTNSHDSFKISWNLLSGAFVSRRGRVNEGAGDEAYRYDPERKSVRKSAPILLGATPRPDDLLDEVSKP